jgi:hypothetical protein
MARLVESRGRESALLDTSVSEPTPRSKDTINEYAERVAKFVPVEVLAFYVAALNVISTTPQDNKQKRLWLFGFVGLFFWIATPLWLGRFSKVTNVKVINQIMGIIAFGIWAYAYPAGWFVERGYYDPIVAGLVLILFTFTSAFISPKP